MPLKGGMANFPIAYRMAWLPRLISPKVSGNRTGFAPPAAQLIEPMPKTARLVFFGDLSAVANRSAPVFDPSLSALFASADLVIGNCESPVVKRTGLGSRLGTHHAMTREFLADALAAAGIEREALILSLANNHMLDQGVAGFEETLDALDGLGIGVTGVAARGSATMVSLDGLTIGFVAGTLWHNASAKQFAGRVALLREMAAGGWRAVSRVNADLVCALPHWDWEFRHIPRRETRWMARQFASRGAGLIVGGHSHVIQPVETLADTVVAYSLGDFLGTAWARQTWPGRISALFVADISTEDETRGQVAAYRMVPYMRMKEAGRERLVPLGQLEPGLKRKAETRVERVLGGVPA